MKYVFRSMSHSKDNEKYLDMISYYLSQRDYGVVNSLLSNVAEFTKCSNMQRRVNDLFLLHPNSKEVFGIAENIVGSMTNMVFAGNVNIKVEDKGLQEKIDELIYDGYFIQSVKEAYRTAISMSKNAVSYLFFNTVQEYDTVKNLKIKDMFLDFEVVPSFYIKKNKNVLVRTYYKDVEIEDKKDFRKYLYTYETVDGKTQLNITGFSEDETKLTEEQIKNDLDITTTNETFDFVPYIEFDLDAGMLPNILWIENSLAENLYFQDEDLVNSQTRVYIPESQVFENHLTKEIQSSYFDKYKLSKVIAGDSIDKQETVTSVEGHSEITNIERNLALNIIQACLDAKISPVSLGYSLIDKLASNTDIGVEKERVSIRKRENDIIRLKIVIAKGIKLFLKLHNVDLLETKIGVIFDPYITPSIESMTNTLSKQVQFGIKSRELAVKQLNKNELSDEEVTNEYEKIKELATQIDYNTSQQQMKKADTNILKSEK